MGGGGARLPQQDLVIEESDDPHPLAWFRITNPEEGREASRDLTKKLWQQTRKHQERFPGRTREIQGKQYLNWEDYRGWRGRWVKGNNTSGLSPGLVMSRWNRWVEEQGGEGKATLAGTLVGKLIPIRFISSTIKHWEVEPLPAGPSLSRLAGLIGFCQTSAAVAGGR